MKTLSKPTEKSDNELIAASLTKMDWDILQHVAKAQPVFAGNMLSASAARPLRRLGLLFIYEDTDLKDGGGYVLTEKGKQFIKWYNLNQITPKP